MNMPGYAGEASLYTTARFYRGYGLAAGRDAARRVVPSQPCGSICYDLCGLVGFGCTVGCVSALAIAMAAPPPVDLVLLGAAFGICEAAGCGLGAISCALNCPRCPDCEKCTNCHSTEIGWCFCNGENCGWNSPCCAPPAGFRGGLPMCCPKGGTCECGGRCVNLKGGGQGCLDPSDGSLVECIPPGGQCPCLAPISSTLAALRPLLYAEANTVNMPGFTADYALANAAADYRGLALSVGVLSDIYPAEGSCKCDWYDWFYDPSCGAREVGCQDPPDPRDPDPFGQQLPGTSFSFLSSSTVSDLSSQMATLQSDLRKQLNKIQRCACGAPARSVVVPPSAWQGVLRDVVVPPGPPVPRRP
jgi:hypothetical protein